MSNPAPPAAARLPALLRALRGGALTALALAGALWRLAAQAKALTRAGAVVIMHERSGFGHTIHGPDVARRLFQGKSPVFVALDQDGGLNPLVAELWPDITVLILPAWCSHRAGGVASPLPGAARRRALVLGLVRRVVRLLAPGAEVVDMLAAYARMGMPEHYPALPEALRPPRSSFGYFLGYPRLVREIPAPPLRLPEPRRRQVEQALDALASRFGQAKPRALCCLYLRHSPEANPTSRMRNGSDVQEFLPAIELLAEEGYQVILTGDAALPFPEVARLQGRAVDATALGVDWGLLSLYAASEADLFIGESGGGMFIPFINGAPGLLVNVFPYSWGLPGWQHYFKTARRDGRLVPCQELFQRGYDYRLEGMTVSCNTAEEITAAVARFLKERAENPARNESDPVLESMPDHNALKIAEGMVSSAWLELYTTGERHENPGPQQDRHP